MPEPEFLVATRKGLFRVAHASAGLAVTQTAFLGDNVTFAARDPRSGVLYASLNHGHFGVKLHSSKDDGTTWEEIATPAYPPFPEGREPDRCPMRQIVIPWNLELLWTIVFGGADQPGRIWCGTLPGGLFKSDDAGASWSLVESLWNRPERAKWMGGGYDYPGIHSICVDPRDSRHITIAISCGGIWESMDDGATWAQIGHGLRADYAPPELAYVPDSQDAHIMVNCRDNPDRFWVQHHNGIFASTDAAKTFTEIEKAGPSVFGFAAAAHPQNSDTAWFVPAIKDERRIPADGKLVVTRTRDGGKSFETLRNGLPQSHAYDLVYRHGLAIDATGDRLAFGSTTGNVYATADQGDSWIRLPASLPPVHSVVYI